MLNRRRATVVIAAVAGVSFVAADRSRGDILYNPVVSLVGDGNTIGSGVGVTTTLQLFQNSVANQGSPVSSLAFSGLVNTNSTVEAMLSNNPSLADTAAAGNAYTGSGFTFIAGYAGADGTAAVTTSANRVVGYMSIGPNSLSGATLGPSQTAATAYASNTFRGATGDDTATNFWTAGTASSLTTGGWRYFNTNTQLYTTPNLPNVRTIQIRNGQLFGGTGSGQTVGIYVIGSGTPTTGSQTVTSFISEGPSSGAAPEQFVLLDDPSNSASTASTFGFDTAYITDDGSSTSGGSAAGGINKWVWNGTSWTKAYSITGGVVGGYRGLAGQLDKSTDKFVLWTTTADGTKLEQFQDPLLDTTATNANASVVVLATAPANDLFRGVALSPVLSAASLTWNNTGGTGDGTTWDAGTNQNFNNGTGPAMFSAGDNVTLNDANNGHYTVTVSGTVTPGSVTVNNSAGDYSIGGTGGIGGSGSLTKLGLSALTLSNVNTYTGNTNVNAGTLTIAAGGSIASATITVAPGATLNVNGSLSPTATVNANGTTTFGGSTGAAVLNRPLGALKIGDAVTATVSPSMFPLTPAVLQPGTLSFTGSAKLDLTNNELVNNEDLPTTVGRVASNQIFTSSTGGGLGTLALSPTQTEVRFTLLGDTNLDGKVDVTDLGNLASSYGAGSGAAWVQGDTNYDGKVDVTDLGNLASNYGGSLSGGPAAAANVGAAQALATVAAGATAVPEPASIGAFALGAVGLLSRRRRR